MSDSVTKTQLYRLREVAIQQAFLALQGTPMQDKDGNVIMLEGKPLFMPPTAATLTAVAKLLKDNGIDHDPIDVPPARNSAKTLEFVDDEEPKLLE